MSLEPAAALILAAGAGERMGKPKALVQTESLTLLEMVANSYVVANVTQVVAVVSPDVEAAFQGGTPSFDMIVNPDPKSPMIHSVRMGFEAFEASTWPLLFVQPVDAGPPKPEVLDALHAGIDTELAAKPTYVGRGGHPLLLRRAILEMCPWQVAGNLREALAVLDQEQWLRLEMDDPEVLNNWNSPEDLPPS